jgi:DNA mismatch endonuclease, patch repair protein
MRSRLHRLGLRFRKDVLLRLDGARVRPDIVFAGARVAVFCDGCFWHRCPEHATDPKTNAAYWMPKLAENVRRDREADRSLRVAGWTVVRVWEHEIGDNIEAVAGHIVEVVAASLASRQPPGGLSGSARSLAATGGEP